uniref:Uncharacterized protein n=1 Tax=Panagrolaimus davidi TaxID=227884 RepID=A0A914RD93_9BILA
MIFFKTDLVYASIWASWSAWSFCANNVQIRVRACNTVRGFTCPGANQERKPCGPAAQNAMRQRQRINNNNGGFGGDYDAVDPWEEDRREALKQLYSDYTPPEELQRKLPAPPLRGIGKSLKPTGDFAAVQRSAGKTAIVGSGNNGYGNGIIAPLQPPPESDFHRNNHANSPGQAPSK